MSTTKTTTSEVVRLTELVKRAYEGDAWHGPSLREALEGIDAKQAAAHPIAGAHSIWEIALHIAGWNDVAKRRLGGEALNEPDEGDFPEVTDTSDEAWQRTLDHVAQRCAALRDAIGALDAGALDAPDGPTAYVALHGILHHIHYHTGQIAVLKHAR